MYYKFKQIRRVYDELVHETMKPLANHLQKAYKLLEKGGYAYDITKSRMDNTSNLLNCNNHYAGIVKGCNKGKMIYIHAENAQIVVLFNKKKYYNKNNSITIDKGMRVFRIYSPLDVDCIENAWRFNSTEKWMSSLDTARDCFTDENETSQVVGDGLTVCYRPTINRLIDDLNNVKFSYYSPIYDGGNHMQRCHYDQELVTYAATCMAIVGEHLGVKDCKAFG